MREHLQDWAETQRVLKGLAESSIKVMRRRIEEYLAYCDYYEIDADCATNMQIEEYMKFLFYKKNAPVTRLVKLSAVNSFYGHFVYRGILHGNPAAKVIKPQVFEPHLQSFTRNDVFAMLKQCDVNEHQGVRNAVILSLGIFCGLRVSEIRSLRLCDVVNVDGVVDVIVQAYEGYAPKRHSDRTLRYLWKAPSYLVLKLISLRVADGSKADDLLIVSKNGKQMTEANINTMLKTLADRADLRRVKVTTHMMRSTFATSLRYVKGHDAFSIMRACGHRDMSTTARYIADMERVTKEYASLAAYWAGYNNLWG